MEVFTQIPPPQLPSVDPAVGGGGGKKKRGAWGGGGCFLHAAGCCAREETPPVMQSRIAFGPGEKNSAASAPNLSLYHKSHTSLQSKKVNCNRHQSPNSAPQPHLANVVTMISIPGAASEGFDPSQLG